MRIETIEGIPVTIPGRAPILTSYGSLTSWARTIVRITTDNGLIGYGDVSARVKPETLKTFEPSLRGLSPWSTNVIGARIKNWNYYPWQKLEPIMAGIEMACLDLQGKAAQVPVYELLGGKVSDTIPVSGLPVLFARQQGRLGEGPHAGRHRRSREALCRHLRLCDAEAEGRLFLARRRTAMPVRAARDASAGTCACASIRRDRGRRRRRSASAASSTPSGSNTTRIRAGASRRWRPCGERSRRRCRPTCA